MDIEVFVVIKDALVCVYHDYRVCLAAKKYDATL